MYLHGDNSPRYIPAAHKKPPQGCVDSALSPGAPDSHHANSAIAGKPSTATNWLCLVPTLFCALHSIFISTHMQFNVIYFNCAFTKLIFPKEDNRTLATMPACESWVGARLSNYCSPSVGLIDFTVTVVSVVFCIFQIQFG
jgi:hypothetical protein